MDAQVRSDQRLRLPAAQPHGRAWVRVVHPARAGPLFAERAVRRPDVGVRVALDRQVPQAGASRTVAALPELSARHPAAEARRAGRRGHRVLQGRCGRCARAGCGLARSSQLDFFPPLRPAAFFWAVLPPLPGPLLRRLWLLPELFPPRLELPGELAIAAARDLFMPFFRRPSYCLSSLTLGPWSLPGISVSSCQPASRLASFSLPCSAPLRLSACARRKKSASSESSSRSASWM